MESCIIELSASDVKNQKIRVSSCGTRFFPKDVIGPSSLKKGESGKNITLLLRGFDTPIKTDIPIDKKIFRSRYWVKEFFNKNNLKPSDKITLERVSRRTYRIKPQNCQLTFIDLFAGIGGTRLAFEKAGCECVFSSEWDKFAQQTYEANFGEKPHGDIRKIPSSEIPDHDILVAGFPCQPFFISGVSKENALYSSTDSCRKTRLFFN